MLLRKAVTSFIGYLETIGRSAETLSTYEKGLALFVEFVERESNGAVYVDEISITWLEGFFRMVKDEKRLADVTRSRLLNTCKSFWNFCVRKGFCKRNIAKMMEPITVCKKERMVLNANEAELLLERMSSPLARAAAQTIYYTGMRVSECLALELRDVEIWNKGGMIHVKRAKGAKQRSIPISEKLHAVLGDYISWRRSLGTAGNFFRSKAYGSLSAGYVNRQIRDTAVQLGMNGHITAHVLRHSFASELIKGGVQLPVVQRILGHSSLAVTSVYCHTDTARMAQAVDFIDL